MHCFIPIILVSRRLGSKVFWVEFVMTLLLCVVSCVLVAICALALKLWQFVCPFCVVFLRCAHLACDVFFSLSIGMNTNFCWWVYFFLLNFFLGSCICKGTSCILLWLDCFFWLLWFDSPVHFNLCSVFSRVFAYMHLLIFFNTLRSFPLWTGWNHWISKIVTHIFFIHCDSETTKNVLIASTYIHLKCNKFAKYTSDLPTVIPRILLSGPAGEASNFFCILLQFLTQNPNIK